MEQSDYGESRRRLYKTDKQLPKLRFLSKKSSLPLNMEGDNDGGDTHQRRSSVVSESKHVAIPSPPPHSTSHLPSALYDSNPISLSTFVQLYSNYLPAEILVTRGDSYSHITLNSGDTLEVHQVRELNIVHSITNDNKQCKIPLNSPVEFCLLYDPENNITKTIRGYVFQRAYDLICAAVRPKLVCARSTWEGKSKDGSRVVIDDREVMVVGGVEPPTKKKGKRYLRLYSITKQTKKVVPEECVGNFSTKPVLLPLYLPEITGYVQDPFPCKAVLQEEGLVVQPQMTNLVQELSGRVLTLTEMTKELALVTTLVREADVDGSCYPVILEVPVNLPQIQVSVLSFTSEEGEGEMVPTKTETQPTKEEGLYEIMASVVASKLWDLSGSMATPFSKSKTAPLPSTTSTRPKSSVVGNDRLASPPPPLPPSVPSDSFLPPPPLTFSSSHHHSSSSPMRPTITHEPMSPRELIKQHGHALPIQVKILSGYHDNQCSLLHGEVYRIHLITDTEGVSVTDEKGMLSIIPLNSPMLFGILHNPYNDFCHAMQGYVFETVSDLVSSRLLPRVISVTASHQGPNPEGSVEPGEVLIVIKVERVLMQEAILVAYSLVTMTTKRLAENCKGCFTTAPTSIRLTLGVILEHMSQHLPMCAVVYRDSSVVPSDSSSSSPLPPIVTIFKKHPKGVLVATTVISQKAVWNPYHPIEIAMDLPVEVVLAHSMRRLTARSRPRSHCITHSFQSQRNPIYQNNAVADSSPQHGSHGDGVCDSSPQHGSQDKIPAVPPRSYQPLLRMPYQASMYQRIFRSMADEVLQSTRQPQDNVDKVDDDDGHEGHEEGVATSPTHPITSSSGGASYDSSSPKHLDEGAASPPGVSIVKLKSTVCEQLSSSKPGHGGPHPSAQPLQKPRSLSEQGSQVSSEVINKSLSVSSQLSCDQMQNELNEKVGKLTQQLAVLTAQLGSLQEKMDTMNRCLSAPVWNHYGSQLTVSHNENQKLLISLSTVQVLFLLESLGLGVYKEQFEKEKVDGQLLCKCSDQVLKEDLKMESQLHRLKLLSFISGEANVRHLVPAMENGTT